MELPEAVIDTNEFMGITNGEICITEMSLDKYKIAFSLFRGAYLGENGYHWSQSEAEKYSVRYRSLVLALVSYYIQREDDTTAEQILHDALQINPLDDDLNERLLQLFYTKKNKAALAAQYNKIRVIYQDTLGIEPNFSMRELANKASKL